MNVVDKFNWVTKHPHIGLKCFPASIKITPTKEPDACGDKVRWLVEVSCITSFMDMHPTEFDELNTSGATIEEAIDSLFELTKHHFGDY